MQLPRAAALQPVFSAVDQAQQVFVRLARAIAKSHDTVKSQNQTDGAGRGSGLKDLLADPCQRRTGMTIGHDRRKISKYFGACILAAGNIGNSQYGIGMGMFDMGMRQRGVQQCFNRGLCGLGKMFALVHAAHQFGIGYLRVIQQCPQSLQIKRGEMFRADRAQIGASAFDVQGIRGFE